MKFIGKTNEEMCLYALDYHSILHFTAGIFGYMGGFMFFNLFFSELSSCLLAYLTILLISLIWEFVENIVFVSIKPNGQQDNVLNSIADTALVFLGGIVGLFLIDKGIIITVSVVGVLFVLYVVCKVITEKSWASSTSSKK